MYFETNTHCVPYHIKSNFNTLPLISRNGAGECRERSGGDAADVLLSLKHAVVHGDCAADTVHPQVYLSPSLSIKTSLAKQG